MTVEEYAFRLFVGMHACISADAPVNVSAQLCVKQVRDQVPGCACVYPNGAPCPWGSPPYLVLQVGGVRQVPSCYRPHNGFYTPGAGTGL